ncbi:MAG TPA: DNA gyrase modulator, partial [Candidatus Baltobacteraceae bacterium]|nr:DNA gyrase modulator [Candidatus Baltobacteraceae bacterium]
MDKHAREALARRVAGLSSADQTEVLVMDENSALTRFTHNAIHQNVAHADTMISVRAVVGGCTGVARTNALDDGALRDVVERSLTIARLAPKDPLEAPLPAGGAFTAPPGAFVPETGSATADLRASLA